MKKVTLTKLLLLNFKGIKQLEINFNSNFPTTIHGDNATGKTTLVDAFTWLLFGKDSTDRKDFSIKTFDVNNQVIHKLDHEVTGVLDVDGVETVLRRVYREKWVTRRGSEDSELQGHETLFFWNDVPMQAGEYQAKVDAIIPEQLFRMITNPMYFNSLKWQDRRNILTAMAGTISDNEIAATRKDFLTLMDLMGNKSFDEFKKEVAAKKKKLKDELALIPARVDEVTRNTPETKDWKLIQDEIDILNHQILTIDSQIEDSSKVYESFYQKKQEKLGKIDKLKTKIATCEHEARNKFQTMLNDKQNGIQSAKSKIESLKRQEEDNKTEIEARRKRIETLVIEQETLREQWMEVNSETFSLGDNQDFTCPTCKQPLPNDTVQVKQAELLANFNANKERRLKSISEEGKAINPRIDKIKADIISLENFNATEKIAELEKEISSWEESKLISTQEILKDNVDYQNALVALKEFEAIPEEESPVVDNSQLKLKKSGLVFRVDELKKQLNSKEQIAQSETRKTELLRQEKEFSSQLANLEKTEFTIAEFTRAKVDILESRINSLFDGVKFRLFDTQLNGGLVECCDTLVDGVPWNDVNNAARINAGIAIINVLTEYYSQMAPIWIDNSESITQIHSTNSQLIELYVSEPDKVLRVA